MNKSVFYKGNKELLSVHKIGFLASRTISPETVLKSYDWACKMRDDGICIVSGFSSKLEKDILHFLLKGTQPIIIVLGRALYKQIPEEFQDAFNNNRILFISPVAQTTNRQSNESALRRNCYITEIADKTLFVSVNEKSSLCNLYQKCLLENKVERI